MRFVGPRCGSHSSHLTPLFYCVQRRCFDAIAKANGRQLTRMRLCRWPGRRELAIANLKRMIEEINVVGSDGCYLLGADDTNTIDRDACGNRWIQALLMTNTQFRIYR
jgi:hypothetical protein